MRSSILIKCLVSTFHHTNKCLPPKKKVATFIAPEKESLLGSPHPVDDIRPLLLLFLRVRKNPGPKEERPWVFYNLLKI